MGAPAVFVHVHVVPPTGNAKGASHVEGLGTGVGAVGGVALPASVVIEIDGPGTLSTPVEETVVNQ
jgi:hypothetical protein